METYHTCPRVSLWQGWAVTSIFVERQGTEPQACVPYRTLLWQTHRPLLWDNWGGTETVAKIHTDLPIWYSFKRRRRAGSVNKCVGGIHGSNCDGDAYSIVRDLDNKTKGIRNSSLGSHHLKKALLILC